MGQFKLGETEGFSILKDKFEVPPDPAPSDPAKKRKITICSLFANQRHSIRSIANMLHEDYESVIKVLIAEKMILDRRKNSREIHHPERRQSLLKGYLDSLEKENHSGSQDEPENIERSLKVRRILSGS